MPLSNPRVSRRPSRLALRLGSVFLGLDLAYDLVGAPEPFGRDRDAGINRRVQQNLGDLFGGDAVVQRAADMHFEFVPARQSRQHADIELASGLMRKPVAQPDVA